MYKSILTGLFYLLFLAGCSSTKPAQFFVLHHMPPQTGKVTAEASQNALAIGVGPVSIPKLLDRPQIVTREQDNVVKLEEYQRWAQPLKDNISGVLSKNLAGLRPIDTVFVFPSQAANELDYRASIDVWQFDASPGQSVKLEAVWGITNSHSNDLLHREHTVITQMPDDASYKSMVNAMSDSLYELSRKISEGLDKIKK